VPRAVLGSLGITEETLAFDGAFFFHGARVVDPSAFLEHGILPLRRRLDRIWSDLHQMISDLVSEQERRAHREVLEHGGGGGQSGELYRHKTRDAVLGGPYAHLVREQHLHSLGCQHRYLSFPEIDQDIARTCKFDVRSRFEKATTPCVVKFRVDDIDWNDHHRVLVCLHALQGVQRLAGRWCRGWPASCPPAPMVAPGGVATPLRAVRQSPVVPSR